MTRTLAAALAALIAAAAPAGAEEPDALRATLHGLLPDDATACFVRAYDKAHLAANPAQSVTFVALVRGWRELEDEAESKTGQDGTPVAIDWREASLRVAFRDSGRQRWESRAACSVENGRIECGAHDCDSGSFQLQREPDGRILITVLTGDHSPVALGGGCGSGEKGRGLGRAKADRVFRLAPAPLAQCR